MASYEQIQQSQGWFNPYKQEQDGHPAADLAVPTGPEPKNVMETLVMMEVVQQLQKLSTKQQSFIKVAQVKAYALNSLPPLYVTSETGWQKQWERGQYDLKDSIAAAVRQGFAAVQRDPLREITPLAVETSTTAEAALKQIQRLLKRDDLTWYTVVPALKQALGINGAARSKSKSALDRTGNPNFDWKEYKKL